MSKQALILFCKVAYNHHIVAYLNAEFGTALHNKLPVGSHLEHIADTEKDKKRGFRAVELHTEEGLSSFISAPAGSRFARFYSYISGAFGMAYNLPLIAAVGRFKRPFVNSGVAELVKL